MNYNYVLRRMVLVYTYLHVQLHLHVDQPVVYTYFSTVGRRVCVQQLWRRNIEISNKKKRVKHLGYDVRCVTRTG